MKFLRILIIIVVILVVLVGILTLVAPTKVAVSRSAVVNAPKEVIWNNVSRFENLNKWSPWVERDPNINISMEGTDGTVGAVSKWEGNKEVGKGSQTFTKLEEMNRAEVHMKFIEPWESEADGYTQLDDTTDGVKVTWGFVSEAPRPWNIFNLFMDMDAMIGKDFEKGLVNLKTLSEEQATSATSSGNYQIHEMDVPAKIYVGKRETVAIKDISTFYQNNLPQIMADVQNAKLEMAGMPSGIYFSFDTVNMKTDMAAVIPVKGAPAKLGSWEVLSTPAGKVLAVDYYGPYEKMAPVYYSFYSYMAGKGMKSRSMAIEEYMTDPGIEKDTAKWLTKIYYYVE